MFVTYILLLNVPPGPHKKMLKVIASSGNAGLGAHNLMSAELVNIEYYSRYKQSLTEGYYGSPCNCMQGHGTECKLMELL